MGAAGGTGADGKRGEVGGGELDPRGGVDRPAVDADVTAAVGVADLEPDGRVTVGVGIRDPGADGAPLARGELDVAETGDGGGVRLGLRLGRGGGAAVVLHRGRAAGEVLRDHDGVPAPEVALLDADADDLVVRVEDVGAVAGAVHQRLVQALDVVGEAGDAALALPGDVLAPGPAAGEDEARVAHPVAGAGAALAGMGEDVGVEHPLAVVLAGGVQPQLEPQRVEPRRGALFVDEVEHLALEGACLGHEFTLLVTPCGGAC